MLEFVYKAWHAGHDESSGNDIRETFVKSVKSGDWDNAIKLLRKHPELGSARISDDKIQGGGTAFHYALWNFRSRVRIIKQLVDSMTKEDLEIQDNLGLTALFLLIIFCQDRVDVAKSMVEKNDKLLSILPANTIGNRTTPLVVEAQRLSNGERMARYLYSVTPHDTLHEVESVADRNDRESINKDHMTPREVFTKSHKELGKEAEESMKNTSTSCAVVGALIVTMMFAAAFTVPGGNNGDTGLLTFLSQKVEQSEDDDMVSPSQSSEKISGEQEKQRD
nr:ankyrin repeat-containing protein NPR4-like [Malus domestica]